MVPKHGKQKRHTMWNPMPGGQNVKPITNCTITSNGGFIFASSSRPVPPSAGSNKPKAKKLSLWKSHISNSKPGVTPPRVTLFRTLRVQDVLFCVASCHGQRFVTVTRDQFSIWKDVESRYPYWSGRVGNQSYDYSCAAMSPCGSVLALGSKDGSFFVYNLEKRHPQKILELTGTMRPHAASISQCSVSQIPGLTRDPKWGDAIRYRFGTVSMDDGTCKIRDLEIRSTSQTPSFSIELFNYRSECTEDDSQKISAVAVSSDGKFAVTGRVNGTCDVWEWKVGDYTNAKKKIASNRRHKGMITDCCIAHCSNEFITTSLDGLITLWRRSTRGRWVCVFFQSCRRNGMKPLSCCITPYGKEAVVGFDTGMCYLFQFHNLKVPKSCSEVTHPSLDKTHSEQPSFLSIYPKRVRYYSSHPERDIFSICPSALYFFMRDDITQESMRNALRKIEQNALNISHTSTQSLSRGTFSPGHSWSFEKFKELPIEVVTSCTVSREGIHFRQDVSSRPVPETQFTFRETKTGDSGKSTLCYSPGLTSRGRYWVYKMWTAVVVPLSTSNHWVQVFVQGPRPEISYPIAKVAEILRKLRYIEASYYSDFQIPRALDGYEMVNLTKARILDVSTFASAVQTIRYKLPVTKFTNVSPSIRSGLNSIRLSGNLSVMYCSPSLDNFLFGAALLPM